MDGLRIESDGTVEGTHVFLDNQRVLNVTEVHWRFAPSAGSATVTLEISNAALHAKANESDADAVREALRRRPSPLD